MSIDCSLLISDPEVKPEFFMGKSVKITDARRVGFMLRDDFLTLRNHSAITTLVAEVVTERTFKLRAVAIGGNNYIRVDNDKFRADSDASNAAHFSARLTELGLELFHNGLRPAILDRYYDVTIGPWTPTSRRSQTPVLIWVGPLTQIWSGQPKPTSAYPPGMENRSLQLEHL